MDISSDWIELTEKPLPHDLFYIREELKKRLPNQYPVSEYTFGYHNEHGITEIICTDKTYGYLGRIRLLAHDSTTSIFKLLPTLPFDNEIVDIINSGGLMVDPNSPTYALYLNYLQGREHHQGQESANGFDELRRIAFERRKSKFNLIVNGIIFDLKQANLWTENEQATDEDKNI
jgi:hypothetical protein